MADQMPPGAAAPPPAAGQQQQQPRQGGGELAELLGTMLEGLMALADALSKSGAPPEATQMAGQIVSQFQQLAKMLSGNAGQQPQGRPVEQASPEQGAARTSPAV